MHDFSQCNIALEFEFGETNGKYMNLAVNDVAVTPDCPHVDLTITLPNTIQLTLSNKGDNDTIVDDSGNIVQDCYVKLTAIAIDGFKINEKFLHQKVIINTQDGQSITTNYFGFNGTVFLILDRTTVLSQCLYLNL